MDIETLTKVADVLAEATGYAGDTAPEEGSEAQVILSRAISGLAEKLGDEDGHSFLRMYERACDRQDATPIIISVRGIVPDCAVECLCDEHDYSADPDGKRFR